MHLKSSKIHINLSMLCPLCLYHVAIPSEFVACHDTTNTTPSLRRGQVTGLEIPAMSALQGAKLVPGHAKRTGNQCD